ncbi:MAG TPA: hypothetical protein DHW81_00260 [Nitrospiraceae bacterium]|nr:hypothetical protein [Nitrospiraceae bacterium]
MRMTISKKLYLGIGVLSAVLIGLAVFFQASIKSTKAQLSAVQAYPELQALLGSVTIDHFKWAEGLAVGTMMLGKEFKGQIDHTQCNLGKWYYGYKPPKELEDAFKRIEEPHKHFHATAPKIIALVKENKMDAAKKVYENETKPNLITTQEALTDMRLGVKKLIDRDITSMKTMQDSMGMTSLIVYALILGSVISGSVLFLARPIKKNLDNISGWVDTTATGDLTKGVDIHTNDEISDMASSFKAMVGKVKSIITQTKESSGQVSVAADQIAEANQNFSQRITEQAASIEETSATMEEMSASIKQTAENAREANKLAQNTKGIAESGSTVMGDTINRNGRNKQIIVQNSQHIECNRRDSISDKPFSIERGSRSGKGGRARQGICSSSIGNKEFSTEGVTIRKRDNRTDRRQRREDRKGSAACAGVEQETRRHRDKRKESSGFNGRSSGSGR